MIGSHKTSVSTPVIFRMFIGECIAFFPTEPGTNNPNTCANYTHVGQHGAGRRALPVHCQPRRISTRKC